MQFSTILSERVCNLSEFVVNTLGKTDKSSTNRWVLSHLSRHKLLILLLFIGAFGNAALAAVIPILLGVSFNAALEEPANVGLIAYAAVGVIVSQSVRAVLQLGRNFSSAVMGERVERDMREELYVNLLGKSMTFHDMQPVGDTMARATNDVHEVNLMMYPGLNMVVGSAYFMLMPLLIAPSYHPLLALAPLFFIVTYILALIRYLQILQPIADRVRLAFGQMNSRLAESVDGVELVKGAGQESQETAVFHGNTHEYRDAAVEQGKIEARFLPLLLLGITQALGFAIALYLFALNQISVGDVVA